MPLTHRRTDCSENKQLTASVKFHFEAVNAIHPVVAQQVCVGFVGL